MPSNDHADSLLRWSFELVSGFASTGIQRAVISPGSRSTPLVYALAECPFISADVVLDERSAGFRALGMAKAGGRAVLLICTSGTAAANYYPAVIEARQSATPLIVCSADRPPGERNTGANQTIDQQKLYGSYPVFFHDTGEPGALDFDLARAGGVARQAADEAAQKRGPVHLNIPFRKPLEPSEKAVGGLKAGYENTISQIRSQPEKAHVTPPEELAETIRNAEQPVIYCGPVAPNDPMIPALRNLSEQCGIPVWLESGSLHVKPSFGFTAAARWVNRLGLRPDLILRFGSLPTSRAMLNYLSQSADIPQVVLRSDNLPCELPGVPQRRWNFDAPIKWDELPPGTANPMVSASQKALDEYRRTFEAYNGNQGEALTDIAAIVKVVSRTDATLMLSNSLIIRDVDLLPLPFSSEQPLPKKMITNRGASGIDGITSTAIGVASAGESTTLLTGDLAFLHDLSSLNNAELEDVDLHIVVINNGGGRIFRMLPFESFDDTFSRYFDTPQQTRIGQLAGAFGMAYEKAADTGTLEEAQERQRHQTGIRLTEVVTDAGESDKQRKALLRI